MRELDEIKQEKTPTKIAIITYNRIGDGQYDSGILKTGDLELYIAQGDDKLKWGAGDPSRISFDERSFKRKEISKTIGQGIDLTQMDHTYVYVGSKGSEEVIKRTKDLDPGKVSYVLCDCYLHKKWGLIRELGHAISSKISCECGGRHTLASIVDGLIDRYQQQ